MTAETTEQLFARYGPRYRWLVAITVLLGTISASVTTTSVVVAIPDIMGAFGIGQAATSKFALLPDPNPSGNFTKITQRLPIRILLKDKDTLLRPGMMVEVSIDVRNR